MELPDFTAIDFETATGARNSACSIGIVHYKNGEIIYNNHFYIKPPDNKYSFHNIMVHGIYAKTTVAAPTFDIIWSEVKYLIEDRIVVAHNASFDRSVLIKTLSLYGIIPGESIWECTYKLTGKNLEEACEMYDVTLTNHHNALDDALACGNLFIKLLSDYEPHTHTNIAKKNSKKNFFASHFIDKEYLKPDIEIYDKSSPFFNKHIVISGIFNKYSRNEIAKALHNGGAYIQSAVNHKTDYVLAGANMGPAKKAKAENLGVPIISEEEFEEMIEG